MHKNVKSLYGIFTVEYGPPGSKIYQRTLELIISKKIATQFKLKSTLKGLHYETEIKFNHLYSRTRTILWRFSYFA